MRETTRLLTAALLSSWALLAAAPQAPAQSPLPPPLTDPGVVPDDLLTLVVGTRFVAPSADETSAKDQFTRARIPLADFNETDHCVDERALEVAKDYFTSLGRQLEKAGIFYFVPDDEIKKLVTACEQQHGQPPRAWIDSKTKIIAFGRVVPTADAPELEKSIR